MARLILKCPYLKGNSKKAAAHLSNLVQYIATREGVEKQASLHAEEPATKMQHQFIAQILREFPDSKDLFEYEDYVSTSTRGNASEFISAALEHNLSQLKDRRKYLDYIANRPRVEKLDTHGLFSMSPQPIVLAQVAKELSEHPGNVWMPIISLRREDAARYGYDNAAAWQALLMAKSVELARDLKIAPQNFRWYAAFHNEGHHPHIHMICYSTNPSEGYLTRVGIQKMKSALVNEIFSAELVPIYREKTEQRSAVKEESAAAMRELLAQMRNGTLQNEKIESLIQYLSERLQSTSGKKQYGYLKADLKNVVNEIVDELCRDERVEKAYRLWWELKHGIELTYGESRTEILPLSQCEDFKSIRNMVVMQALHLHDSAAVFEEEPSAMPIAPEPQEESTHAPAADKRQKNNAPHHGEKMHQEAVHTSAHRWSAELEQAKHILSGEETNPAEIEKALALLHKAVESENPSAQYFLGKLCLTGKFVAKNTQEAVRLFRLAALQGNAYVAYRLGKLYLGGEGILKDVGEAVRWLEQAAEKKNAFAEYALGTLYSRGEELPKDMEKAISYLRRAAAQNNAYAQYRLGKLYLTGEDVPKDAQSAMAYLKAAAAQGNQYAQYALGKLYFTGTEVEQDKEKAKQWFNLSAAQGNEYAKYFLEHINDVCNPSAFLAATRLLRQLEKLFQESAPLRSPQGMHIDRKRRLKLNEKKRAAGHKQDDHEQTMSL